MTTRAAGPVGSGSVTLSAASQLGAKVVHLLLNAVSTLAVLRYLAPDAYGTYVLILTITTLVGVVADFGLPKLAVREMLRPGQVEGDVVGTVIVVRLGLAGLGVVGVQAALLLFQQSPQAHLAGFVASLGIIVEAVLGIVVTIFHTRFVQQYEAGIRVVAEAIETALVLVLIARGVSLPWLFVPPLVGLLVGTALAVRLASRRFGLRPRFEAPLVRGLVREALPLGPALMIGVLYLKLDSFVVAALRPSSDLGLYGAAYQPIEYLFLGSAVFINVLYPLATSAWATPGRVRFVEIYRRGTELLVALMLVVPVVVAVVADELVLLAFGPAYAASALPLQVLGVAVVLMTVNAWQSLVLLSGGHQRVTLRYNLAALALSLVLCLVLVHAVGLVGAALAAVATGLFVLWASTRAVRHHMDAHLDVLVVGRIIAVAAVATALLWVLDSLRVPWPLAVLAALAAYAFGMQRIGLLRSLKGALT
ncbi:oligosaccharide flippase family protein [Humibacillus xanthopallidus]|uniref:oligosaccharide flippase family protein n=1 Tax=Humibacillus xanthopallidus TaxID=412689 RepID=UPI00384ECE4C